MKPVILAGSRGAALPISAADARAGRPGGLPGLRHAAARTSLHCLHGSLARCGARGTCRPPASNTLVDDAGTHAAGDGRNTITTRP